MKYKIYQNNFNVVNYKKKLITIIISPTLKSQVIKKLIIIIFNFKIIKQ